jgi:hypothetical protein
MLYNYNLGLFEIFYDRGVVKILKKLNEKKYDPLQSYASINCRYLCKDILCSQSTKSKETTTV